MLQLTELELVDRERRAADRRLKAARFPTLKTLEDFDFTAQPSLNKVLVAELMRCAFLDQRESVILLGHPGTGKTHLATALAMEACRRGKRVRFWRVIELVTHLLEAREERLLLRLKAQLAKLDLLVLDELGYVPTSKVGAELLFDVISTAYERTSIIVTTNLPFEQWTEVLGSERLVGATLDQRVDGHQSAQAGLGKFEGADERAGLVARFFVLGCRIRVDHDAGARLHVGRAL